MSKLIEELQNTDLILVRMKAKWQTEGMQKNHQINIRLCECDTPMVYDPEYRLGQNYITMRPELGHGVWRNFCPKCVLKNPEMAGMTRVPADYEWENLWAFMSFTNRIAGAGTLKDAILAELSPAQGEGEEFLYRVPGTQDYISDDPAVTDIAKMEAEIKAREIERAGEYIRDRDAQRRAQNASRSTNPSVEEMEAGAIPMRRGSPGSRRDRSKDAPATPKILTDAEVAKIEKRVKKAKEAKNKKA